MGKSWVRQMEIRRIRLFFNYAPSQDTGYPYLEVSLPIMKSTYKLLYSHTRLVVSNIWIIFHHIWDVILPIDFHIFQNG